MKTLLDPKLDLVFKKIFTADTEILADLINSVLRLSGRPRILTAEVRNPDILPEEIRQKYIILDILATDEAGTHYDIEMQVRGYATYPERAVYYVSRLYSGQLASGKDYEELKPVIGIHFLDYYQFPDYEDFRFCFELRDLRHPELRLTDNMALHIFELRKFEKTRKAGLISGDELGDWLYFLNHAPEEGDKTMRRHYKNPSVLKALDVLENLSADDKVRRLAEIRERALRNEISELAAARREGKEEGKEEGIQEERITTAEKLLRMGVLTPGQVAEATGLSEKDVAEIRNTLGQTKPIS